jgi:phospholipid/cholesterol/gamma-HCH transport system substrate-binding protein
MEVRARYILIGSFTLTVILGLFGFAYWIKNTGGIGQRAIYQIRFDQPVVGLTVGSNVLFNGIRAGVITKLALDSTDPKRVDILISLDPAVPIRSDTKVDITYQGLIGAPAISLKGGDGSGAPLSPSNQHPPILLAAPGIGQNLSDSARETLSHLDQILTDNAKPLHTAIEGFSTFAEMLGKNSNRLEAIIGGLEKLTGVGEKAKPPPVFDLAVANSFPSSLNTIKAKIVVPDPTAILAFDTQNILVRSADGVFSNVENAKWADNLPKLVQARILQSFENARQLTAVDRPGDQSEGVFRLELGIRNFQISPRPTPTALVEFSVRLVSDKGDVVDARIFNAAVEAQSELPVGLVAAFNVAFSKAAKDIVIWAIGQNFPDNK